MCGTADITLPDCTGPYRPFCLTEASTNKSHTKDEGYDKFPGVGEDISSVHKLHPSVFRDLLGTGFPESLRFRIVAVQDYIDILRHPQISSTLSNKLHTSPDIDELKINDSKFGVTVDNIVNIIGEILEPAGFRYRIDIKLRNKDAEDDYEWKHADITIKIPEEYYHEKNRYWKEISSNVSKFYKSLKDEQAVPEDTIDRLRKFIYIVVYTED